MNSPVPLPVELRILPPVATVTLGRLECRGALNRSMIADLDQAFDDLHHERRVRVVVLQGRPGSFCSGLDLREMNETALSESALMTWQDDAAQLRDLLLKLLTYPKPIVAAVEGPALGAGLGLALASDLIVAAPQATFGLPEIRMGLVAGLVAPLLSFRTGAGLTAHLALTGRTLTAQQALDRGLVHHLASGDDFARDVREFCDQLVGSPAEGLMMTKRLINETIGEDLTTLLSAGAATSAMSRTTEAAAEGLAAFIGKRPPQWP